MQYKFSIRTYGHKNSHPGIALESRAYLPATRELRQYSKEAFRLKVDKWHLYPKLTTFQLACCLSLLYSSLHVERDTKGVKAALQLQDRLLKLSARGGRHVMHSQLWVLEQ